MTYQRDALIKPGVQFFATLVAAMIATTANGQKQEPLDLEVITSNRIDPNHVRQTHDESQAFREDSIDVEVHEDEPQEEQYRRGRSSGRSGGGGGGGSASGGSARSWTTTSEDHPNYQIEVAINGVDSISQLEGKLIHFSAEYELTDSEGRTKTCTFNESLFQAPGFETSERQDTRFLYVALPKSTTKIESIKGFLIVSDGYSFEAFVKESEFSKKTRKRVGDNYIEFEHKTGEKGDFKVDVVFTVPESKVKEPTTIREMQNFDVESMIRQEMKEANSRMVQVLAKGDDDEIYSYSSANSSGGSQSGGGGGSFGGSFGTNERPERSKANRRGSNARKKIPTSNLSVGFELPDGVRPVALKCVVMQRTGDIKRIPFEIKNIPINNQNGRDE